MTTRKDSWSGQFDETRLNTKINTATNFPQTVSKTGNSIHAGVISWNIGENITASKMDELRETYFQQTDIEPDLLFVGLQEVPVSAGLRTRNQFKEQFYKKIADLLGNSFSQYHLITNYIKPDTSVFNFGIMKEKNLNLFTCANIVSGVGGGFGIATYILVKKDSFLQVRPIAVKERCVRSTKGYCVVTLLINEAYLVDVVNTHMPFESMEATKRFANDMLSWLDVHGFRSPTQLIMGDLNSRSLLTSDCYAKNITVCDTTDEDNGDVMEDAKYCFLKSKLENMTFEESVDTYSLKTHMRVKKLTEDNCDIAERVSKHRLTSSGEKKIGMEHKHYVRILTKSDVLSRNLKSWFPDFKEAPIAFLPTYKRDLSTGEYSLSKKDGKKSKGRLPGYADRILYKHKGHLKTLMYRPLGVKGNDHIPIASLMKISVKKATASKHTKTKKKRSPTKKKSGGSTRRR